MATSDPTWRRSLAAPVALSVLSFAAGVLFARLILPGPPPETERGTFELSRLTSPYLECPGVEGADPGLVRARDASLAYVRHARSVDSTLQVSMYVRDLDHGSWIGIDENESYFSASLLKVPVMIYLLVRAEGDPSFLAREAVFPGPQGMSEEDSMEGAPADLRMQAGATYTYSDLLYRMIVLSDNFAMELLMADFRPEDVKRLMATIHAEEGLSSGGEPVVSPRGYGLFFRVLYNATFLGRPMSEHALSLLSEAHFTRALRRYIPEGVTVASKFGFRLGAPEAGGTQLHECGIVYQPGAPYLLCVMTRSDRASPDRLAELIAEISRIVWGFRVISPP
jgi:beta-lactamase class A